MLIPSVQRLALTLTVLCGLTGCRSVVRATMTLTVPHAAEDAVISYDDVDRFAAALTRLDSATDSVGIVHRYLAEGTDGLRAYADHFKLSDSSLLAAIRRRPAYYRSLRDLPQRLRAQEPRVRAGLLALERLYAPSAFPTVYYVVGAGRGGGQSSRQGLLIGAEVYAAAEDSTERIRLETPRTFHALTDLAALVVHETVHYNQSVGAPFTYFRQWDNLARALKEGSADFIAELATGRHINAVAHAYGAQHEAALWAAFAPTLQGTETGPWFFTSPGDGRPSDLGYFLGYRVVRAYALRRPLAEAAREIMELSDYRLFLDRSGYAPD